MFNPKKSEQKRHRCFIIYLLMLGAFVIFFRLGYRDMWNGLESESAICLWAFWRSLDNNEPVYRFVMAFQIFLGFGVLIKVTDYNFTLDALALKPSDFCNVRVHLTIMPPFYSTSGVPLNISKLPPPTTISKMPITTLLFINNPILSRLMENLGGLLSLNTLTDTDVQHTCCKADNHKIIIG